MKAQRTAPFLLFPEPTIVPFELIAVAWAVNPAWRSRTGGLALVARASDSMSPRAAAGCASEAAARGRAPVNRVRRAGARTAGRKAGPFSDTTMTLRSRVERGNVQPIPIVRHRESDPLPR